jgi:hypothetical protein
LMASAGLEGISCIRLFSSSSPHQLHSALLLIVATSAAFGSSPHRLRIRCILLFLCVVLLFWCFHLRVRLFQGKVSSHHSKCDCAIATANGEIFNHSRCIFDPGVFLSFKQYFMFHIPVWPEFIRLKECATTLVAPQPATLPAGVSL